jgi:PAS domain S-box-containing protein
MKKEKRGRRPGELSDSFAMMAESPQGRGEERLAGIAGTLPIGIAIVDTGGRVTFANAVAEEILGLDASDVPGRFYNDPAWKITALDGGPFPDEELPFTRVMATGKEVRGVEHAIEHPDGTRVFLSVNAAPLHDAEGNTSGMVASLSDITERKHAEMEMKENEARFRGLFDNMSSGVAVYEAGAEGGDFLFKDFNQAAEKIEGVKRGDLIGKSVLEIFPGVRDFGLFEVFQRVWRSGNPEHFHTALYEDKRIQGWRDNYIMKLPSGEIVAIYDDVTERKEAEQALQRSESYYSSIISNAPDMITILDDDLTFRWGSRSAGITTGHAPKDIYGRSVFDYIHPEDMESARKTLDSIVRNPGLPVRVEFRFRHNDGSFHYHEGTFSNLLGDPTVQGIICNTRDITGRKQAEEEIRRAMERLSSLRDIDVAILEAHSFDETARAALKHLRRLISCRRAAVVLIDTVKWEAEILSYDTDDVTSLQPGTRFSLEGGTLIEDLRKGEMRIIEDVESIQNPHPVFQRLRAEGIRSGIYFPLIAHGELIGLLSMESDEPGAFSMADIDIYGESAAHLAVALYNARLLGEVRRYADELESRVAERTAQLEAINRELEAFSYSVSHDLRAPLRAVDGFSQALLEDYYDQLDEQGRRFLNRIRAAAQRMAELIDDILGLSRVTRGEMRRETVDMTALALVIAEELRSQEPGRRADFVIEPGMVAEGDPALLRLVLLNLLDNAFKFTAGREEAHIEFGTEKIDGRDTFFVRDNGAGFDMDYAGKLFGVFQRLHSLDEFPGTGIGLATVQRIINRHGGEVWGEGEEGRGATFYFTIPESEE